MNKVSLSSEFFQGFFSLLFLLSLVAVIWDPFGYMISFSVFNRSDSLHNLTALCFCFLACVGWRVFKRAQLKIRLLLTAAFCVAAYGLYDLLWFLGYFALTPFDIGSLVFSALVYAAAFMFLPLLIIQLAHRKFGLPGLRFDLLAVVFVFNLFAVLLLDAVGFFQEYFLFWNGLSSLDPHSSVWFFGKILGMCSWILVFWKRSPGNLGKNTHSFLSLSLMREKIQGALIKYYILKRHTHRNTLKQYGTELRQSLFWLLEALDGL